MNLRIEKCERLTTLANLRMSSKNHAAYVVERKGDVIAYCVIEREDVHTYVVRDIFVEPKQRGRGVATTTIKQIHAELSTKQRGRLVIDYTEGLTHHLLDRLIKDGFDANQEKALRYSKEF